MSLSDPIKSICTFLLFAGTIYGVYWFKLNYRSWLPADLALGEQIYRRGTCADGEPLRGITQNDIAFADAGFNCEQCHRRSGFGSSEGGTYVLPITGNTLFKPRDFERSDLFNKLFKESQDPRFWARMRSAYQRPAYDEVSLARAIRDGIDPSGRVLSPLMPRYRLDDNDMKALTAYLKQLSTSNDPGVDDRTVYLATIVDGKTKPADKQAMLSTISAFVEWLNLETQGNLDHPNFSPGYRSEFAKAFRLWQHEVWELPENPQEWQSYLLARYQRQPVFAFVGGIVEDDWTPIHRFCEDKLIPCLFPMTDLPPADSAGYYSLYFNQGLILEAKAIGQYLKQGNPNIPTRIINMHSADARGKRPAHTLAESFGNDPRFQLVDVLIDSGQPLHEQWPLLHDQSSLPTDLVIWPGEHLNDIVKQIPAIAKHADHVWLPSGMLEQQGLTVDAETANKLYFSYPYELPGNYHPHTFRVRAWMNTRRLPIINQGLQFNTYYALNLLQFGLEHVVDHFSKDYLLEFIEQEAENNLNPGTFPRLSLGPGQRYASKGAYIVQLDNQSEQKIHAVSDWLVP